MNNTFINLFASQPMCRALQEAGLSSQVAFTYKIYKDRTFITCPAFDHLGLYSMDINNNDAHVDAEHLPAYMLGDLLSILPDWCISKTNNTYEVSIDKSFEEDACKHHTRYVDAIAEMVLQMLASKKLDLTHCNYLLTNNRLV